MRCPENACAVIAVLRGGRVPASLIAHQLGLPLHTIRVAFRDEENEPVTASPCLIGRAPDFPDMRGPLLLVDDVSVSGATFIEARRHLNTSRIITVVLKGRADIVLMPDLPSGCVQWPWNETL
ncbi:MAG: phosphoribosyltransferase family protein [Opitutales bacterium]